MSGRGKGGMGLGKGSCKVEDDKPFCDCCGKDCEDYAICGWCDSFICGPCVDEYGACDCQIKEGVEATLTEDSLHDSDSEDEDACQFCKKNPCLGEETLCKPCPGHDILLPMGLAVLCKGKSGFCMKNCLRSAVRNRMNAKDKLSMEIKAIEHALGIYPAPLADVDLPYPKTLKKRKL